MPLGATFFCDIKSIDGIWRILYVAIYGACVMPTGYIIEDHHIFVVDFATSPFRSNTPP